MTLRIKLEVTVVVLALVGGVVGFRYWLGEHDARLRAESNQAAQKLVADAAAKREAARAVETKQLLAQLASLQARTRTPEQVVQALPQVLPLPAPFTLDTTTLPDAPVAKIPIDDLKPLFDFAAECQKCKVQLSQATRDKVDEDVKLDAMTKDRDVWKKTASGGSWFTRVKRAGKWFAIGAVAGGVAVAAGRR